MEGIARQALERIARRAIERYIQLLQVQDHALVFLYRVQEHAPVFLYWHPIFTYWATKYLGTRSFGNTARFLVTPPMARR